MAMAPRSIVLFHKVPAIWESMARKDIDGELQSKKKFEKLQNLSVEEKNLLNNLETDIFFLLSKNIADYVDIDTVNVVLGQDPTEIRNWDVISRDGMIVHKGKFVFWSTSSPDSLPFFENVEALILRGNYPNFHNKLIKKYSPSTSVFYPATSLFFPHFRERMRELITLVLRGHIPNEIISEYLENLSSQSIFSKVKKPRIKKEMTDLETFELRKLFRNFLESCIKISDNLRERESPGNYSIVLYDEESNHESLSKIYPRSRLLPFKKAASPNFYLKINSEREYDIVFTGTTIQKTKNHSLFYEIVDGIVSSNPDCRIAIVGVTSGETQLKKRWPSNVDVFGRITKNELLEIYNQSKSHIITSGRDCFPRTIPESVVCGCHVLVLDIISDGLSVIEGNPLIGTIIDTKSDIFIVETSYSVSVKIISESIVSQISSQMEIDRDHLLIATIGREIFSVEGMVQLDMIWQEIDLSLRNYQE